MLQLSPNAAAYVDGIRRRFELPESTGLRIWMDRSDTAGVRIGFSDAPETDDDVVESAGARVFVAPELSSVLRERVLDVEIDAEPPQLVLRRAQQG